MNLDEYENLFKKNKWDKYLPALYDWWIKVKDIEELIQCIIKIEDTKIPLPNVKIIGEGEIKCDPTGCSIEAPKDTKILVGAPKGFTSKYNGKRAWLEREFKFDDNIEKS